MLLLRTVPLARAAFLLTALAMALPTGCLTRKTFGKWKEMPLESVRLEVVSAASDRVVLAFETTYRGNRTRSGEIAVDPHLPGCEEVAVDIRRLGEFSRLPTDPWAEDDDQSPSPGLGPCAMMVLIAPRYQDVALEASTADRRLGRAEIEAPHNHIWLAVVPLAATADLALFIATLPIGVTTSRVGGETTYYTWTWNP